MSTNEELHEALGRWRCFHRPEDFAILYNALWPIVLRHLQSYPEAVQDAIRGLAWGHFIDGFYKWSPGTNMKTWFASHMHRMSRDVKKLLYPGVPEHRVNHPDRPKHP